MGLGSFRLHRYLAVAAAIIGLFLAWRGQHFLDVGAPYGYYFWGKGGVRALAGGFLVALALALSPPTPSSRRLPRGLVYGCLGLLVVLAFALRAWGLADAPPGLFYDEAANMHEAMRITERGEHFVYTPANNGNAALYFYQMAALFKLFGVTPVAARLTSALSGAAAVLLLFLLARRLFDEKAALVAAALLATSRWHLIFSRIAFSGVQATLWPTLALLLLWIALRLPWGKEDLSAVAPWPRLWRCVAAGAALALCLYSYLAAQVMAGVIALLLFFLVVAAPRRFWAQRWGLAVFLATFLVVLLPLALYVRSHPEEFNQRAGQVWVLADVPAGQRAHVLADNVRRTLLLFDFVGDSNPRHNLPYRRMLDYGCAALLPAALFWALANCWRPAHFACLVWFVAMLLPGMLSGEAPHALRTLATLPPLLLLLASLLRELGSRAASLLPARLSAAPGLAFLCAWAWLSYGETRLYFHDHMAARDTWDQFESITTPTARAVRQVAAEGPAELHCNLSENLSVIMELWEDRLAIQPLRRPSDFLLVDVHRRQAFVQALVGGDRGAEARIRRFFPKADVRLLSDPFGRPAAVVATVSPEDYARSLGLAAVYLAAGGEVQRVETGESLATRDAGGFALPPPFEVEWTGMLVLPESTTACFTLECVGEAGLWIDGATVVSRQPMRLCAGLHAFTASYVCSSTPAFSLTWDRGAGEEPLGDGFLVAHPLPRRGLLQVFYDRPDWQGEPDAQDVVERIDFEWTEVPGENRLFSMEWRGTMLAPFSGIYELGTCAQDHSRVMVDGKTLLDRAGQGRQYVSARQYLVAGPHELVVRYSDSLGFSFMQLYWQPPGGEKEIVSAEYLSPP